MRPINSSNYSKTERRISPYYRKFFFLINSFFNSNFSCNKMKYSKLQTSSCFTFYKGNEISANHNQKKKIN